MILLYHLVFPDSTPKDTWNAGLVLRLSDFKRQILWLKNRFEFLSLEDYLISSEESTLKPKKMVALTFDDGYRAVFDLVSPFLEEEQIPATFFVNTSHLQDNKLYWFVYFNALCSERAYPSVNIDGNNYSLDNRKSSLAAWSYLISLARQSGDPIAFSNEFQNKYPLPPYIVHKYQGMTLSQIIGIGKSNIFSVGGHTHSHPYLDLLTERDQYLEIIENKQILENLISKPVKFFAFTGGEYNLDSLYAVKRAGFKAALALKPKNLGKEAIFEIPRIEVYSPSLIKLELKLMGIDQLVRKIGLRRSY